MPLKVKNGSDVEEKNWMVNLLYQIYYEFIIRVQQIMDIAK